MFDPVPMLRLNALVLDRDERAVLRELGRLGAMHLTRTPAGLETAPLPPHDHSSALGRCDRFLARVEELRRHLKIPTYPAEPVDMTLDQAEERLLALEKQAGEFFDRRQQLFRRQGELTAAGEQMASYRGLAVPLDQLGRFSFLHFVTGSLPPENLEPLQESVGANVVLLAMPKLSSRQPLIALTSRTGRHALESVLQRAGFQNEALPSLAGATADTLAETSRQEAEQVATQLEQLDSEVQALATTAARPLAEIEQMVDTERCLLDADQNFPRTEAAVLLRGWVPATDVAALKRHLKEAANGRCVIESIATSEAPEDQIPVLLRHSRLLRPFEMLVAGYGLPRYRELAPTLFVAISYMLMFGMMFGDVGHGAVLAIAGVIMLLTGSATRTRDMGLLLLLGGLASAGFGAVYGSCFGIERLKTYALWHDPLEGNPMNLMYCAMGFGVLMISLGLILNCINCFRRGEVLSAFLGKFGVAGILFYWGALFLLINFATLRSHGLTSLVVVLLLVLPVLGWVLREPLDQVLSRRVGQPHAPGSLLIAIAESVVDAFEGVLLYMANTISFVRLAAYAMSHAALLMAIALLAIEVNRLSSHGSLPGVLVLIGGNLVAIILEGIIASVQALRLEYYEFFGKFFSGSGQPFKPFCLVRVVKP